MSIERRIEQILGLTLVKDVSDRLTETIDEIIDCEAFDQLQIVIHRILAENVPYQV